MREHKAQITLDCRVDSYRAGRTVVDFLAHRFKYHTPERWEARVANKHVQVNGRNIGPHHVVQEGDVISYTIFHNEPEVDFHYDIIYEDEHLLAVSKSGNLPVHACGVFIRNTLIATLKNRYGDHLNLGHRLDRETSGVVVLSKDRDTARKLAKMFETGRVSKSYLAVVHGRIAKQRFEVDAPIGKAENKVPLTGARLLMKGVKSDLEQDMPRYVPRREVNFETGKPSRTLFTLVEDFHGQPLEGFHGHPGEGDSCYERAAEAARDEILTRNRAAHFTTLHAVPISGRTNQIRVHLSYIGHPIVGDKVYGRPEDYQGTPLIRRQALHCRSLQFDHPITGEPVELQTPVPDDMEALIRHRSST